MNSGISIFGLGYVGCVSAACFAKDGHAVIGVDANPAKVDMVNKGRSTILEEGIAELVAEVVALGRLRATTDVCHAVTATSVSLVCVGTPSRKNGSIDLSYIERVCTQIGEVLRSKDAYHTVVIRSTVLPGTIEEVVIPALELASGKKAGEGFGVCSNPEFLREGTSIKDFYDPPFTIIGAGRPADAEPVRSLYAGLEAPVYVTELRVAETVKYACNCYHGLKVGFANEIGNVCKAMGIDSHEVMNIFCADTKLNVSAAYLRPGFAFGGSCLPKDLRAITYRARQLDVETPVLTSLLDSNRKQIVRAYDMVLADGRKRVGILGMAFKAGTDDLRESPMVSLIEMLIGRGMQVTIYDRFVSSAQIIGANREYIEQEIPHIWSLIRDSIEEVVSNSDIVVIGNGAREFQTIDGQLREGQVVLDLVRAFGPRQSDGAQYQGICW
jgi:GDP-mannose 6-dehydrogenase